ncbi:malonyl-CoA decarboxylase-domain-containing protein [Syncephalis plumigaleata]|nr:malonyl-CoA decarboxylase-domain-containing protein [Syncephalis plumigaleata]
MSRLLLRPSLLVHSCIAREGINPRLNRDIPRVHYHTIRVHRSSRLTCSSYSHRRYVIIDNMTGDSKRTTKRRYGIARDNRDTSTKQQQEQQEEKEATPVGSNSNSAGKTADTQQSMPTTHHGSKDNRLGMKEPPLRSGDVKNYWNDVAKYGHEPGFFSYASTGGTTPTRPDLDELRQLIKAIVNVLPGQGDILPSISARRCCEIYQATDEEGKLQFLRLLGREFGVQNQKAAEAAEAYLKQARNANNNNDDASARALLRTQQILRHTLQPMSYSFFDRINRLPDGMQFLVELRTDLLRMIRQHRQDVELAAVNDVLREKLQGWLLGFLKLERITWASPAALLEKVIEYEAVHPFQGWGDVKQRLGPGRRCFGFFHRSLPLSPLVSVQVALVPEISDNVQAILTDPCPGVASDDLVKCGIFYSISTRQGLSGVELGSFLIKRVVGELKPNSLALKRNANQVEQYLPKRMADTTRDVLTQQSTRCTTTTKWMSNPILVKAYLIVERRNGSASDPVAHFHLRNGACVYRINWLANTTDRGNSESCGMMVNYNYIQEHVESNNQTYLFNGRIAVNGSDRLLARTVSGAGLGEESVFIV